MEIFRRNKVRFIAVNNGIDSENPDTLEFDIEKGRFSFRLTAPYSEERREAARQFDRENNAVDRLK